MVPKIKMGLMPAGRLWIIPAVVLGVVSLFTTMLTFAPAQAQDIGGTVSGDFCIEGLVIDWEEDPLPGITVRLFDSMGNEIATTMSAEDPDDKDADIQEGEFEFDPLPLAAPDTYTVAVDVPADWEGVTPTSITFDLEAGRDGCVKIRFKLRPLIYVTAYKIGATTDITGDHPLLEGWRIEARPGPGNFFAEVQEETTNISGTAFFTLTPGSWIFVEREPEKENKYSDKPDPYMPVVPPGGQQSLELDIDDVGATFTVVFKNEFKNNGCIIVRKYGLVGTTDEMGPPYAEPTDSMNVGFRVGGWGFKLLKKNGEVFKQGVTDATGELRFEWLPYGPYTIVEEDRVGWDEISDRFVDVTIDSGECVTVPFENEQNDIGFCIEGYKIDKNGGYGIADWEIKIKPLEDGGFDPPNAFTDGLGKFRFEFPDNDYRIPGATYEICEDDDVDGWKPSNNPCRRVTLPEWPMAQCAQLEPFVNEQIGHKESTYLDGKHDEYGKRNDGKDGYGPSKGGSDGEYRCRNEHVVKDGEGLFSIGDQYKVSAQAMLDANPWVREKTNYWLQPGDKLCIP